MPQLSSTLPRQAGCAGCLPERLVLSLAAHFDLSTLEKLEDAEVHTRFCGLHLVIWLVVWNMNFICPYIGNFIIPTDELIFFRGVGIPPTRLSCALKKCMGTIIFRLTYSRYIKCIRTPRIQSLPKVRLTS